MYFRTVRLDRLTILGLESVYAKLWTREECQSSLLQGKIFEKKWRKALNQINITMLHQVQVAEINGFESWVSLSKKLYCQWFLSFF